MAESSPTVSVIIPAYNRARYLPEAVDSVLAQTHGDLELIVVDDGSTDDTPLYLRSLEGNERVRVLFQENSGQAKARNTGLRAARGEFVCFLDSDNRWKPTKLEEQLALMHANPDVGVVYGENDLIDASGNIIGRASMRRHSGWITRELLVDNFVNFNTAMTRKQFLDAVGGLNESVRIGDDYDLWLRVSMVCKFLYVPTPWGEYRVEGERLSGNTERRLESNRQTLERFLQSHPKFATDGIKRYTWCRFYCRRGRYRASVGRRREALADYWRAIRMQWRSPHPWRALGKLILTGH